MSRYADRTPLICGDTYRAELGDMTLEFEDQKCSRTDIYSMFQGIILYSMLFLYFWCECIFLNTFVGDFNYYTMVTPMWLWVHFTPDKRNSAVEFAIGCCPQFEDCLQDWDCRTTFQVRIALGFWYKDFFKHAKSVFEVDEGIIWYLGLYGHLCMINICTGIYFHLLHVCKNYTQDRVVKWTTKYLFTLSAVQHNILYYVLIVARNTDLGDLQPLKSEIYLLYFYFSFYLCGSA